MRIWRLAISKSDRLFLIKFDFVQIFDSKVTFGFVSIGERTCTLVVASKNIASTKCRILSCTLTLGQVELEDEGQMMIKRTRVGLCDNPRCMIQHCKVQLHCKLLPSGYSNSEK